jgi:hypothetical protein
MDEDLVGKRVKVINSSSMYFGQCGKVEARLDWYGVAPNYKVTLDNTEDWNYFQLSEIEILPTGNSISGCECGCSAVGSPRHSYYCKLYPEGGYG